MTGAGGLLGPEDVEALWKLKAWALAVECPNRECDAGVGEGCYVERRRGNVIPEVHRVRVAAGRHLGHVRQWVMPDGAMEAVESVGGPNGEVVRVRGV